MNTESERLYNELFIGITYLLPYDSFDPASPARTIATLQGVIDERNNWRAVTDCNDPAECEKMMDDAHTAIQVWQQQRAEIDRLQKINADLRNLAARMEQLTDLALFANELMADEEFTDLYLRWQGFDPEQIGKDMQQIALDAMKKAQGTED